MEEGEIPHSTSSGRALRQAQGRFSWDAGMTGMCPLCQANVSSIWPDVSTFRPNVSSFCRNVSSFRPDVFTLAGQVFGEEGVSGA